MGPSERTPARQRRDVDLYASMHHVPIMRTTVDLADHLLIRAKKLAAAERTTLTAVLEDSLRLYFASLPEPAKRKPGRPRLPVAHGGKPLPGVNLNDTSALLDVP